MHHKRVLFLLSITTALLLASGIALAQAFLDSDWVMDRANNMRRGGNNDLGLASGEQLAQAWVWPPTADLPAEIVVDNGVPPNFDYTTTTGQSFTRVGTWVYPLNNQRPPDAWPPVGPTEVNNDPDQGKAGDYVHTSPTFSATLRRIYDQIGREAFYRLPNLPNDEIDPNDTATPKRTIYKQIHDELVADTRYARWSFGTQYPTGSVQGTVDVSGRNLIPGQRYAVFIHHPSSGTVFENITRPNTANVMVRVSWGADVNDPVTSRIFVLDFSQTGGWQRIRSIQGEDRYFPYDGVNPIRVTLYSVTPDRENEYGTTGSRIVADAVRLVPEAMRGDIRHAAVSAVFPPGTSLTTPGSKQLTFFGRDETVGPPIVTNVNQADQVAVGGFQQIPFNPTLPPQTNKDEPNYNPYIPDPTSSIRTAVFYCFEDDLVNRRFGRLRWRHVARPGPTTTVTVDDGAASPSFTATGGFTAVPDPTGIEQSYAASYRIVSPNNTATESAVWQAPLSNTPSGVSYSVFVWIPAGDPSRNFAHRAHYVVTTDRGDVDVYLDQRNTLDTTGAPRVGTWRRLISGVRFPAGTFGGNPVTALGKVTLHNDSPTDAGTGRVIAADAVLFMADSSVSNGVTGSPLLANVRWPSGTIRSVLYCSTTSGLLALDAIGPDPLNGPPTSTLTTVYWAYPSISNPEKGLASIGVQDDPNLNPDPFNNQTDQGIDGDLEKSQVDGQDVYTAVRTTPRLGAFSSPIYVEVQRDDVRIPYIVAGNSNGRVYAFDPVGRVDPNTNEPYAVTFASGDNPGIPGTTRRLMTWPTTTRDAYLAAGGGDDSVFQRFASLDQQYKGAFIAAPAAPMLDANFRTDRIIIGAGLRDGVADGHVYAVDMQNLDPRERISNQSNNSAPRWQYPNTRTALEAIEEPCVLTGTGKVVFSAGHRVYVINNPNTAANGLAALQAIYPFTATPPGNPATTDKPGYDDVFTAPVWRDSVSGLNGGNEVIFVASRDGTIFAFDGTQTGGQELPVLWHSQRAPSSRASAVFLRSLTRQPGIVGEQVGRQAILLPNDAGVLNGYDAVLGTLLWTMPDASNVGLVPVEDEDGNTIHINITSAWRGADAITANGWVYSGDEGNQDAGEHNGQMRAYASASQVGLLTPGEPELEPEDRRVEILLVDLWNTSSDTPPGPWDAFGVQPASSAKSPYHEMNNVRPNTQGNITIFEWGDSISVAAWGAYTGSLLPTVTFRLYSGPTTRPPVTVGARPDLAYSGPPLFIDGQPAQPWVARARLPLRTGNNTDPQTPGSRYTVFATARIAGATVATSRELAAGMNLTVSPPDEEPRRMAVAHPLTLTTRGPSATSAIGAAFPNIVGWMNDVPPDNQTGDLSEVLGNGNAIVDVSTFAVRSTKDMVAPLGFVSHGTSGPYLGVDNAGNRVPALYIADRSNMYKVNQPITNVRVERGDLAWGWNPNDTSQQATGNVMNPLPWEDFPNRVPNSSADYPNMDRSRAVLRGNGIDMALQGITLPPPTIVAGNKRLNPLPIDLQVNVPQYQPANINTTYFDITGAQNAGLPNGLLAPMVTTTGRPPTSGSGLEGLLAPSAGYYGSVVVYIDSNNNGTYQGTTSGVPSNQQAATTAREEVFRQFQVGVAVPPDVSLRTEEETIDLGKMPHGGGYDPTTPFAPSYVGPYAGGLSPWDTPGLATFFRPFTVKNTGNVNLVNVRVAKIIGVMGANPADPTFWARLMSDQVEPNASLTFVNGQWRTTLPSPPIWAVPFNFLSGQGGTGNIGVVSSLDHGNSSAIPNWDHNFWPYTVPVADYVQAGNVLGWAAGTRPRPTLHKPRPGDPAPTVMSIPDVAHGDPLGLLNSLRNLDTAEGRPARDTRPSIGIAVPLGTPTGTYSAPVYVFEDHTPEQWRAWQQFYGQASGQGGGSAALAQDDNGLLDTQAGGQRVPVEAFANPTFTLKVDVGEARLTNGVTPGSYFQIDRRALDQPPFGANLQPAALRDRMSGNLLLFWASNRPNSGPAPTSPDTPWFLNFSQLNAVTGMAQTDTTQTPVFDWRYAQGGSQWWNLLPSQTQFPGLNLASRLFPSQSSDVNGNPVPVVAGYLQPNTVRFASPALAQDETDPASPPWLFFQGAAIKSGGTSPQSYSTDTRTFYTPLQNGEPNPPGGIPYSFLNDPAQPKYAPKPIILTDVNGRRKTLLFWYGGAKGRTRLFYNAHLGNLADVSGWSRDTLLPTPGALQWQSDPYPVHRRVYTSVFNPNGEVRDVIDLVYTGVLRGRKQAETILTRYALVDNMDSSGNVTGLRLRVVPLPTVENELLAREGVSQTWSSRDIAWVYRDAATRQLTFTDPLDGTEKALFSIFVNYDRSRPATDPANRPINLVQRDANGQLISPIFDEATGLLYFASALGGRIVVDPQAGTVTFPDVAPRASDAVTATYTPQAMRLNVTRDDVSLALDPTTLVYAPAAWVRDAGLASRPHVVAPGSNTGPVAFIDRALNPRGENILPGPNGARPSLVTRLWTFFRKTDSSAPTASTIYYKTMRLMVRLPRGVLRDANGDARPHVRISGNRGPVEIDWVRGRLYFNEEDEGNVVTVSFDYARNAAGQVQSVPPLRYHVAWGDEITTAAQPGDQTTTETVLPTSSAVNEGQISAFKDPFQDKVWVFWSSTRAGTSDLYYMTISPQFYAQPGL